MHRQAVPDGRDNILAWPGSIRDARTLITSHIDTVPPFYPYRSWQDGTDRWISGRGSVDAKASIAAQLVAANTLLNERVIPEDDIAFLFVVGEETGGDGMIKANELDLKPQTVIFGEPTENKLVSGHKGLLNLNLTAKGKACHSGYPWLGLSANELLLKALTALKDYERSLPVDEKYGRTTINIGRMSGGIASNVVAEHAEAQLTIRIAQGSPEQLQEGLLDIIKHAGLTQDEVELQFHNGSYGPIDIDHDVDGFDTTTVNYGTDVPHLTPVNGQKRYLFGGGSIFVAHSDHEAITEADLHQTVRGFQKLILHSLRNV